MNLQERKIVMNRGKKYLLIMLLCCFVILISTTGCLQDFVPQLFREQEEEEDIVAGDEEIRNEEIGQEEIPEGVLSFKVYFMEGKNHYLLPITILKPWTEGVARAALEKLVKGPSPAEEMRFGISTPLPPRTKIVGINIREGLCRVDFSKDFLDYDPGLEREVLGSVIYTLLQFNTVNEVEIVVEGSPVEVFPGGTPGKGTFDQRYSLNLEVGEGVEDLADGKQHRLFFCALLGDNHIFYVPVTRVLAGGEEQIETTITELFKGPRSGSGLFSDLPADTKLKNFSLQGGILEVDFSADLLNYQGGRIGEANIKNQLVLTLTALPGVERVQILVEGEQIILPQGTSFRASLTPPLLVNQLID